MVLTFSFSTILERLDTPINVLCEKNGEDVLASEYHPCVRTDDSLLGDCLHEMYTRGSRICMVKFPNGIPLDRKYAAVTRAFQEHSRKSLGLYDNNDNPTTTTTEPPPDSNDFPLTSAPTIEIHSEPGNDKTPLDQHRSEEAAALQNRVCKTYVILDMRDVLCLVVERYTELYLGSPGCVADLKDSVPPHDFINSILQTPLHEVANISGRNDYTCVPHTATLRELLLQFEKSPRVPIFSCGSSKSDDKEEDEFLGVFSVSNFMGFLERLTVGRPAVPCATCTSTLSGGRESFSQFSNKPSLTPLDTWTAGMIKSATQPVRAKKREDLHICFEDESLFDALKILYKTGFSAVPVVAHSNPRQCLGILSVRDLQPILLRSSELFISSALVTLPVLDYVSSVRQMESLKARYPVIHVHENATLDTVFGKILAANIRRLLLTDSDGLLTGILSVTDLGRFIAREFATKT